MATNDGGRIFLKNGSEADWNKLTKFIPGKGEVIIYNSDETHNYSRIKTGDGVDLPKDLQFVSTIIPGFDPDNIIAKKVEHKLTFGNSGAYQYDGSADVTVPVYTGNYGNKNL